jgi:glycosyltransferase involved in cell wall biosynthesis
MPAFQAARFIGLAVESVRVQTVTDWQLVVVDDCSTDETSAIVATIAGQDPRVRLVRHESNRGASGARNTGYAHIAPDSEYVIFLDCDDVLQPQAFERLLAALAGNPQAVAAHGLARNIDGDGRPFHNNAGREIEGDVRRATEGGRRRVLDVTEPTPLAAFAVRQAVVTPGLILIRRSALAPEGPQLFDQGAFPADDWDMWLRLTRRGPMAFVPEVLIAYRRYAGQASGSDAHTRAAEVYVRRKFLASATPEQRRLMLDGYRYAEQQLGHQRLGWLWSDLRRLKLVGALRHLKHGLIAYKNSLAGFK